MKRIFYIIALLAITYTAAGQGRSNNEMFASMENYNRSVVYKTDGEAAVQGRNWWSSIMNVLTVAGADIIGAAAGVKAVGAIAVGIGVATGGTGTVALCVGSGVICGAGASYAAGSQLGGRSAVSQEGTINYGKLSIVLPRKFIQFSNMGIMHNNIIHNNFFLGHPLDPLINALFDVKQRAIFNSDKMTRAREVIEKASGEYVRNKFDVKALTNELHNADLLTSDCKRVLELFMDKYITCWEPPNIEHIVNFYIREVANSSLTENEQHALVGALMVASESPFYFLEK